MRTARIFRHGNGQAVRLPKEFGFAGNEVQIRQVGAGILLLPCQVSYEQIMTVLERFKSPLGRGQNRAFP